MALRSINGLCRIRTLRMFCKYFFNQYIPWEDQGLLQLVRFGLHCDKENQIGLISRWGQFDRDDLPTFFECSKQNEWAGDIRVPTRRMGDPAMLSIFRYYGCNHLFDLSTDKR